MGDIRAAEHSQPTPPEEFQGGVQSNGSTFVYAVGGTMEPNKPPWGGPLLVGDERELGHVSRPAAPRSLEVPTPIDEAADSSPRSATGGPRILPIAPWVMLGSGTNDGIYAEPVSRMGDGNSTGSCTQCPFAGRTS